mmetsp:Transcript_21472/g.64437  ORF Transcript_21472/g.64437 Transcript_21472/m.64437 type:complete len:202 (+) Transcript_21472:40-645(+)
MMASPLAVLDRPYLAERCTSGCSPTGSRPLGRSQARLPRLLLCLWPTRSSQSRCGCRVASAAERRAILSGDAWRGSSGGRTTESGRTCCSTWPSMRSALGPLPPQRPPSGADTQRRTPEAGLTCPSTRCLGAAPFRGSVSLPRCIPCGWSRPTSRSIAWGSSRQAPASGRARACAAFTEGMSRALCASPSPLASSSLPTSL